MASRGVRVLTTERTILRAFLPALVLLVALVMPGAGGAADAKGKLDPAALVRSVLKQNAEACQLRVVRISTRRAGGGWRVAGVVAGKVRGTSQWIVVGRRVTAANPLARKIRAGCPQPKPTPTPAPPPPPSPPAPPPPVPPQATYEFGTNVSSRLQQLVPRALGFAGGYFRTRLNREIPPLSVYVYTDLEEMRAAWTRVEGGSIEDARRLWPATDIRGIAPRGKIFLFVQSGVGDVVTLSKIVVHEAFHNLQWSLLGGRALGDPAVSPVWLKEGSAEYIAYRTIAEYGLDTIDNIRRSWIQRTKSSSAQLRALETYAGFRPQDSPFPLSALATERLTEKGGETLLVAYFETVARGGSWPDAFRTVFGRSVEAFYDEFETYRRGL